jgi:putative ABC transport system ATP-binding protein
MDKKWLRFFFKANKTVNEGIVLDHGRQNKCLIELRQINKIYHTDAGDFTALRGVDLQVNAGEFLAIIGKSGSGKSTILNMITGVDRPTAGEVIINGAAVHAMQENQLAVWRGRNIGIVFQFFQLLPTLSVLENIMLPMDFCNMYEPAERQERAMSLLKMVEMTAQANKLPTELSGGQQQRVAIVRALANDPPILVADEPTGNLDSKTADAIFTLFDELVSRGKTILMVTHDSDIQRRVKRAITVADGEIVHQSAGGNH